MNPEVKAKWVAALRSGKYKQARGSLRTESGFCCLGVACDLHRKEFGVAWDEPDAGIFYYRNKAALPPESVSRWAGYEGQPVMIGVRFESLSAHNDSGRTFAEIADAIEAQL